VSRTCSAALCTETVGRSPYAGLVSRLVALVLDGLVVTVLVLVVATVPGLLWSSLSPHTMPRGLGVAISVVTTFIPVLYFTTLWTMNGQTLGGLATGIVVEHRDGHRLSPARALVRAAIGLLFAPLWLLGMLFILIDPQRRAWHDRLLRTDVRYAVASHRGQGGLDRS
jgi:uncharacterized RDD family membrane protein YckC